MPVAPTARSPTSVRADVKWAMGTSGRVRYRCLAIHAASSWASVVPPFTGQRQEARLPMPDPKGFLKYGRAVPQPRPVALRLTDWRDVYQRADDKLIHEQATRCMNCGIPF